MGGADPLFSLKGRRGIVVGVANARSIAYGCARAFVTQGAEVAITHRTEKARPHVEPLARELGAPIFLPCDVQKPGELEAVFEAAGQRWGTIDFVLHSIAFAPRDDLHGRVVDSSRDGFLMAMDISCHSFARMARLAEPLMPDGGTLLTIGYEGSHKVIPSYGIMGPVKAALESMVYYLAAELGPRGIRVHALAPNLIRTRAASGLKELDRMVAEAEARLTLAGLPEISDVGAAAAFLVSDGARRLNGLILPVDSGTHVRG